ncbi:MAG: cation transporter dimerization domain-containing protein, partial [Planctomycetota bacterium]
ESSADLMDTVPGKELEGQTREALEGLSGVKAVEEVQAHRFGPYLVMNVTIGVDGATTVEEGDRIASEVEHVLCSRLELVRRAYVHYHPARQGQTRQGGKGPHAKDAKEEGMKADGGRGRGDLTG